MKINFSKNRKIRNWSIAVIIVLMVGFLASGVLAARANFTTVATEEARVVSLEVAETVNASGSLQAQPFASLKWKASGVVETVNARPDEAVKAGEILLSLQPSSTSANIVSAQADLVQAQKEMDELLQSDTARAQSAIDLQEAKEAYERAYNWRVKLNGKIWIEDISYETVRGRQIPVVHSYRGYADPETIADADRDLALKKGMLEDAQRAYDRLKDGPNAQDVAAAQARVDAAQATVNSLSIIAPFDGVVLSVNNHVGDVISTGDLSVNLADLNHLYVETEVDESDIAGVKLGNPVEVTLDALPGVTLTGRVTAINPVGEVVSGLVKYTARIDLDKADGDVFLPLGSTANAAIQIKEASETSAVPILAIQNDNSGEYVWVIQADGSTLRVDVVSGAIIGDFVTVSGDLKKGDRVQLIRESSVNAPNPFGD